MILLNKFALTIPSLVAQLAQEEWQDNKALCEYCQVATLASFASLAIALPEVTAAFQQLTGSSSQ